jgi:hypothetical protein
MVKFLLRPICWLTEHRWGNSVWANWDGTEGNHYQYQICNRCRYEKRVYLKFIKGKTRIVDSK